MHYLIDGYNLLHATGHLVGKVSPAPWSERAWRCWTTSLPIWAPKLITQPWSSTPAELRAGTAAEENRHGVRILNALETKTDDLIEVLIRAHPTPHELTVVSQVADFWRPRLDGTV